MTSPNVRVTGPRRLTTGTSERTDEPTDGRVGIVTAVTNRGLTVDVAGGVFPDVAHLSSYNPGVGDPVMLSRYRDSWIALGRPVGPGTPTDNASPGTGIGSTLLDGVALSGSGVTVASSTGALVPVPRYAVTYFHPAGHWVELRWCYSWFSTVTNDVLIVRLVELGGTAVQIEETQPGGGVGNFASRSILVPPSLGGARRSWTMTLQRFSGSGTSRIDDAAARRGSLLAVDAGDQAIIRTV